VSPVREELAGDTGNLLASWLEAVDLLIIDDLDFGWAAATPGEPASLLLAKTLGERLSAGSTTLFTAHVPLASVLEQVDPAVRTVLERASPVQVTLAGGPSLRTGRTW
jgi:hypothetical protein